MILPSEQLRGLGHLKGYNESHGHPQACPYDSPMTSSALPIFPMSQNQNHTFLMS